MEVSNITITLPTKEDFDRNIIINKRVRGYDSVECAIVINGQRYRSFFSKLKLDKLGWKSCIHDVFHDLIDLYLRDHFHGGVDD